MPQLFHLIRASYARPPSPPRGRLCQADGNYFSFLRHLPPSFSIFQWKIRPKGESTTIIHYSFHAALWHRIPQNRVSPGFCCKAKCRPRCTGGKEEIHPLSFITWFFFRSSSTLACSWALRNTMPLSSVWKPSVELSALKKTVRIWSSSLMSFHRL